MNKIFNFKQFNISEGISYEPVMGRGIDISEENLLILINRHYNMNINARSYDLTEFDFPSAVARLIGAGHRTSYVLLIRDNKIEEFEELINSVGYTSEDIEDIEGVLEI